MHRFTWSLMLTILTCSLIWNVCEAKDKGSIYILGGSKGCGPGILYKTGDKKGKKGGELIIMNSCGGDHGGGGGHYESPSYIPWPMPYPMYHRR